MWNISTLITTHSSRAVVAGNNKPNPKAAADWQVYVVLQLSEQVSHIHLDEPLTPPSGHLQPVTSSDVRRTRIQHRSVIWKNDFLTLNRFIKLLTNQQKFRTSNESFIRMNSRREDCFHHTWRTPEGFNVSARRVCFNLEITARLNKTHLTGDKSWFVGTWCADYNLWPCLSFFWC